MSERSFDLSVAHVARPYRRYINIAMVLALFVVTIGALTLGVTYGDVRELEQERSEIVLPAAELTSDALARFVDQETSVRGYIISGDRQFLEPFQESSAVLPTMLAKLGQLVRDIPPANNALTQVEASHQRWLTTIALSQIATVDSGKPDLAQAEVKTARGKQLFDRLRQDVAVLDGILAAKHDALDRGVTRLQDRLTLLLVLTLAALALLIIAGAGWLGRRLVDPLGREIEQRAELIELSRDAIITRTVDGPITFWSKGAEQLYGFKADEVKGRVLSELLQARWPEEREVIRGKFFEDGYWSGLVTYTTKDGREVQVDSRWVLRRDADGNPASIFQVDTDVSDRITSAVRRATEERFRRVFASGPLPLMLLDVLDYRSIVAVNDATCELFGLERGDLIGAHLDVLADLRDGDHLRSHLAQITEETFSDLQSNVRVQRPDGSVRWVDITVAPVFDKGALEELVVQLVDVTEQRAVQEMLTRQALHDGLTGLANRTLFDDRLTKALANQRRNGIGLAVLYVDLDVFKHVNDSFGHEVGDLVLRNVASQLESVIRETDTVARLGGDEFVVCLSGIQGPDEAVNAAEKILLSVQQPIDVGETVIRPSASIGIALAGESTTNASVMLREADAALYKAKRQGRGGYAIFDEGLRQDAMQRVRVSGELHDALEANEIHTYYQPIVTLFNHEIVGVEALMRWKHPQRGLVMPGDFLFAADDSSLIRDLSDFVLRQAITDLARWRSKEIDLFVSVNVEARQLLSNSLAQRVERWLSEGGVEPHRLWIEIPESMYAEHFNAALDTVSQLRDIGVTIALDDFGTGNSSLDWLARIPLDVLKVDRRFVDGIGRRPGDQAVLRAVAGIGEELGLRILAEGIETVDQREALLELGFELGQGFLFSRAVEEEALVDSHGVKRDLIAGI